MKIGLFIPCYIDQFYPAVGVATLEILEKLNLEVIFPKNQTCCGQPMANSGFEHLSGGCNTLFARNFSAVDYIVCPSGSCTLHIKEHWRSNQQIGIEHKIMELTEFLVDILKIGELQSRFPYKVGLHQSCHGQRGLGLSKMSELMIPFYSKPALLLGMVDGLELMNLSRADECCGFGGTFCVTEESVSVKMGKDRIDDHLMNGVECITSTDMSCLMHLEGIIKRQGRNVMVKHIAEILNATLNDSQI